MDIEQAPNLREFQQDYRWDGVTHLPYKEGARRPSA